MLLGWDHLLFVLGVVLLAGTVLRAVKLISLFVAGHSLTLIVASLAGWTVNATAVDIVIALSVIFVAVVGLRGQPSDRRWFGAAVFGFGLVHGLGLATRLQDAGLPDDGILAKVLAFNVGVEVGQVLAVGAIVAIGYALARSSSKPAGDARRLAFSLITLAGVVGVAVLLYPGSDEANEGEVLSAGCKQTAAASVPFDPAASHPERTFYGPKDPVDEANLDHVMGDGFLIVRYDDGLSPSQLAELEQWHRAASEFVVVAPDPAQDEAVRALTRDATLVCGGLDIGALTEYSDSWFRRIGQA